MKKSLIQAALSVCAICASSSVAFAQTFVLDTPTTYTVNGLTYTLEGSEANLYFANKFYAEVCYIPSQVEIEGTTYPVTSIGVGAFIYNQNSKIVVPNSVKEIEYMAFYEQDDNLQELILGSGVQSIGVDAFETCQNLKNVISTATTAPEIAFTSNEGLLDQMTLHIAAASKDSYDATWTSHFGKVVYHNLKFSETEAALEMGSTYQVPFTTSDDAQYNPYANITWRSSDPTVAVVDGSGLITPRHNGTCTITATTIFGDSQQLALTVSGEQEQFEVDGVVYTRNRDDNNDFDGTVTLYNVTSYTGKTPAYEIPSSVNDGTKDYTVTIIGVGAFSQNECTKITVPSSVTTIATLAFYDYNDKLETLVLGENVAEIGVDAFETPSNLSALICYGEKAPNFESFVSTEGFADVVLHTKSADDSYKALTGRFLDVIYHGLQLEDATIQFIDGPYTINSNCYSLITNEDSSYFSLIWENQFDDVAMVSQDGVATPVGDGSTMITVTDPIFDAKAYMTLTVENTATSITEIEAAEADDAAAFDLMGRRVAAPRAGQIIIKNGKLQRN